MELSNEVAAELAGAQDHILRTLEEHLDCEVYLRGNVVTLDGDADAVQAGATVVRELSSMVERGHDIGPATIESVARVLDELVTRAVEETGAESQRDMGKAIKHVMTAAGGRADGRRVSTKVKEALS